jgi:hypothetical protein
VYLLVASNGPPRPSSLLGHWIGILGFVLMLATETLYSLRKASRGVGWGRTEAWLSFHIFTGIVGPYMVFLHTGFQFAGLAGVALWMTLVVVGSGFVGRYIYTAIPRTPAGAEMEAAQLEDAIRKAEAQLQAWLAAHPAQLEALAAQMRTIPVIVGQGIAALLSEPSLDRRYRRDWQRAVKGLDAAIRPQAIELDRLLYRHRTLRRQFSTLATVRHMMSIWHTAHVPLGLVLFTVALLHVVAALYYS